MFIVYIVYTIVEIKNIPASICCYNEPKLHRESVARRDRTAVRVERRDAEKDSIAHSAIDFKY